MPEKALGRLIFINLAIDQLWDSTGHLQRLYPVKIPDSENLVRSNEDLGLFLSGPGDTVLGAHFDPAHLKLLERWSSPFGTAVNVRSNPWDLHHWVGEVEQMQIAQAAFEFWPCSLSSLENSLLKKMPRWKLPAWLPAGLNATGYNQKTEIFKWGEISGLPVPATAVVSVAKLLADGPPPEIAFPLILKADWGSSGTGNLLLTAKDDHKWRHFVRQLRGQTAGRWLAQAVVKSDGDFTVFGFAGDDAPKILRVDYDADGVSIRHRDLGQEDDARLRKAFARVSSHLKGAGYVGPFSFDVVKEKATGLYHLLDMNVRWTRTQLIHTAAQRLGWGWGQVESRRVRFRGRAIDSFSSWWSDIGRSLGIDETGISESGEIFLPYLMAAGGSDGPGMKEVSFFVTKDPDWIQKVVAAIQYHAVADAVAGW